jgi:hypothetical protein
MRLTVIVLVLASACTVGSIEGSGVPGPTPTGGGGEMPDAAAGGGVSPDAAPVGGGGADASNCKTAVTANLTSGHHNAGQDCMQGCHNHGFTLSGTLYASANGGTPVTGGTITVTDAKGVTFDMVTQLNGNFWTANAITFPITVVSSLCPNTNAMVSQVTAGNGGCNKTGCHTGGAQGSIHLP